jgi:hypothetical protein
MAVLNNAGFYKVEDSLFTNKLNAAIYASEKKKNITWEFHDGIFANTLKSYILGSQNLADLYTQRAQQLRDTYDYLVLHYSGGADSWNILNTFLKNNIKLDYIFVKWPIKAMDKNLYIPNAHDTSAVNFVSEWDYVLKKDIHWLKQNYPEIKIEIYDWLDNLQENFFTDDLFQNINLHRYYFSNLLRLFDGSNIERELIDKGKKVGSIFGVDKPIITEKNNQCFFYFVDSPLLSIDKLQQTNETTEYFYWTPNFPMLAIEQANRVFQFYKKNPQYRHKIQSYGSIPNLEKWTVKDYFLKAQSESDIAKMIIYPEWNWTRFQAEKPIPGPDLMMSQKDIWLETLPIMSKYREIWYHYYKSYTNKIDKSLKLLNTDHIKPIQSIWYTLGNFET